MALFDNKKYYKPGKGVEKDEPQKKAFFRFLELYGRKIWKFIITNLIYFVVLLPVIMHIYGLIFDNAYYALEAAGITIEQIWTPILHLTLLYYQNVPAILRNILLIISIIAYGPAKAGITYVYRNFSKETHAWISDIWDKAKENLFQAVFFGILDFAVVTLVVYNLTYTGDASIFLSVSKYVSVLVGIIYCFMRKYTYPMMVTVNLSIGALLKNAWLFAFIGIFRNVFSALLNLLLWVGTIILIIAVHPFFEIPLIILFIYSFTGYINIFACYPLIDRYLVKPILEKQSEII